MFSFLSSDFFLGNLLVTALILRISSHKIEVLELMAFMLSLCFIHGLFKAFLEPIYQKNSLTSSNISEKIILKTLTTYYYKIFLDKNSQPGDMEIKWKISNLIKGIYRNL
jgi:hypothetical protein